MKPITRLDYARYWLVLTAAAFAVGSPFIVFLHFFHGNWFELLFLSMVLSSYFTLILRCAQEKQKRQ